MAKVKAFRAKTSVASKRETIQAAPGTIPSIPEDQLSPEVTRQMLGNFLGQTPKSAKRSKKKRKGTLERALSTSYILDGVDEGNHDDDRSVASTRSHSRRSRSKETGQKHGDSLSSLGTSDNDDDRLTHKSHKKKSKSKGRKRSSSIGRLRKALSIPNFDGKVDSDDDNDNGSVSNKGRRNKKNRRDHKLKKNKSVADIDMDGNKKAKKKRKNARNKLKVLSSTMKKTIGLEASLDNPTSGPRRNRKGGSLQERRLQKRKSQEKLKGAFDKMLFDPALGATKTVGKAGAGVAKGAVGGTKAVGKGAIGATKSVGKAGVDLTIGATKAVGKAGKMVGKGATDITKTVGKGAIDMTKNTSSAVVPQAKGRE